MEHQCEMGAEVPDENYEEAISSIKFLLIFMSYA